MSKRAFRWQVIPTYTIWFGILAWIVAIGGADQTTQIALWAMLGVIYPVVFALLWRI